MSEKKKKIVLLSSMGEFYDPTVLVNEKYLKQRKSF